MKALSDSEQSRIEAAMRQLRPESHLQAPEAFAAEVRAKATFRRNRLEFGVRIGGGLAVVGLGLGLWLSSYSPASREVAQPPLLADSQLAAVADFLTGDPDLLSLLVVDEPAPSQLLNPLSASSYSGNSSQARALRRPRAGASPLLVTRPAEVACADRAELLLVQDDEVTRIARANIEQGVFRFDYRGEGRGAVAFLCPSQQSVSPIAILPIALAASRLLAPEIVSSDGWELDVEWPISVSKSAANTDIQIDLAAITQSGDNKLSVRGYLVRVSDPRALAEFCSSNLVLEACRGASPSAGFAWPISDRAWFVAPRQPGLTPSLMRKLPQSLIARG